MNSWLARVNLWDSLKKTHFTELITFIFALLTAHSCLSCLKCFVIKRYVLTDQTSGCISLTTGTYTHSPFCNGNFLNQINSGSKSIFARVEFPCRCGEKRHRTLRECYRRNTLTGSGVSCCRGTLLGRSMHLFSVPLLSLLGLGHLT